MAFWGNPYDTSDHLLRQGEASRGAAVVASSGNLAAGRIQRVDGRLSAWVGTSGWRLFWAGSTIVAIALTAAGVVYVAKEQIIDALLGENPLGDSGGAGVGGWTDTHAPHAPVPAEVTPPPPKIVPEDIEIEKPKFLPRAPEPVPASAPLESVNKSSAEAEVQPGGTAVTEKPAPVHHVSKETYDLAARNLGGVDHEGFADNTLIPSPNESQVTDFKSAMHARGIEMSDVEAKQALEDGGFENRGTTYEIWHSKLNPNSFVATGVHDQHWLNGNVHHIDSAPLTPDAAPAEFSDADKAQYQKFTEGSATDTTFRPSPDHYQEAALSRDGIFGGADGMRETAHTLNGFTAEEIRTQEPPAGASTEVVNAWHKMQGWLNGEAAHTPYPPSGTHISAYLLSIGMIG